MKYFLQLCLLFYTIVGVCQTPEKFIPKFTYQLDSLGLWKYDFLPLDASDSLALGKIDFYNVLDPTISICFNVYAATKEVWVSGESSTLLMISNCVAPNTGGDYYTVSNFILFNKSACVHCRNANSNTDVCRGNIEQILALVQDKEYGSFNNLCANLPIEKKCKVTIASVPQKIQRMVNFLITDPVVYGSATGDGGTESSYYKMFKRLVQESTVDDLKILLKHPKPVIRAYAYWALVLKDKNYVLLNTMLYQQDNAAIGTLLSGCITERNTVAGFVTNLLNNKD